LSAAAVIKEAAECGVRISLNGRNLALKAPAKPSAALLAKLKQHKAEIAALLQQGAAPSIEEPPEPDDVELEERKAMATGSVPEPYLDAWARLQCQRPTGFPEEVWRQAMDDGGCFLDRLGKHAPELGWMPGDLFNVPSDGRRGGLVWFLRGEGVNQIGIDYAQTTSGRVFKRWAQTHDSSRPPA
jgi:hypothetical protein